MDEYLKIKEAATLLEVTTQTLRNWDQNGKLKAKRHKMNKYRLYKKVDLEKLRKSIVK